MRLRRSERGASLVEFALVAPLLFLLVFSIIDFGRYMSAASSVNTATRESTRYGSSVGDSANGVPRYTDCDEIIAAGAGFGVAERIEALDYTIQYDHGPSTAIFDTCPAGGPNPDSSAFFTNDRIIVTVSTEFQFVTPFLGDLFGPTTITSTNRKTILQL